MDKIMFSIILPVYNREYIVKEAIKSVINQKYDQWELIIIDDGSSDKTMEICKGFSYDERIIVVSQKNNGVSSARNNGLKKAKGDYVLFLDSDNSFEENIFEELNQIIIQNHLADVLCFGFSTKMDVWRPIEKKVKMVSSQDIVNDYLPTHINIFSQEKNFLKNFIWNKCYNLKFLRENNISFDEQRKTWEDGKFVVNCLACAESIILIPRIMYKAFSKLERDHLSDHLYKSQIGIYIKDEIEYKHRFEKIYDFYNEHYCHSNFSIIDMLFVRVIKEYPNLAKKIIIGALNEAIVIHWITYMDSSNGFELMVKKAIKVGKVKQIYFLYKLKRYKTDLESILNSILNF